MLLFLSSVNAKEPQENEIKKGHVKLLAVSESDSGLKGSTADLYLEIRPGNNRVFIETIPLTRFDTQVSMRFAKETVCDFFNIDCGRYDFSYTIKAGSNIIGGPSAGAASALLTSALLNGFNIRQDVAVTGTINSGALVGPVGGVKEKIEAASASNISIVLIPAGERFIDEGNFTLDLVDYGRNLGIKVIEVGDLTEAVSYATGREVRQLDYELTIDKNYNEIMKELADDICRRSRNVESETKANISEAVVNLTRQYENAYNSGRYYSAASFCFGRSVRLRQQIYSGLNNTEEIRKNLENEAKQARKEIEAIKISTATDLQAYMLVRERLDEAEENLNESDSDLGYNQERIYSAKSWARFFGAGNRALNISEDKLKDACLKKLSEAQERFDYLEFYIPVRSIREEISNAQKQMDSNDYALCIHTASRAKASANIVLSSLGVERDNLNVLLDNKLRAAKREIQKRINKGDFPLAGYSYYEYANSLRDNDINSALLYAEYSLELSNFNYLEGYGSAGIEEVKREFSFSFGDRYVTALVSLVLGVLIGFILFRRKSVSNEHKTPRNLLRRQASRGKKR